MSSLTIIFPPKCEEIPDWVAEDLVDLTISLCTPQQVLCIGYPKGIGDIMDITDVYGGFAVSPNGIIYALKEKSKKEAAKWFDEKFKYRHSDPNGDIILINENCCEYNA